VYGDTAINGYGYHVTLWTWLSGGWRRPMSFSVGSEVLPHLALDARFWRARGWCQTPSTQVTHLGSRAAAVCMALWSGTNCGRSSPGYRGRMNRRCQPTGYGLCFWGSQGDVWWQTWCFPGGGPCRFNHLQGRSASECRQYYLNVSCVLVRAL